MQANIKFRCSYPNCENSFIWSNKEKIENKHFYKFRKNKEAFMKWKKACGFVDNASCINKRICEDHFQRKDFINITKHRLNPNAVPHIVNGVENRIPIVKRSFENHLLDHNYCLPLHSVHVCNLEEVQDSSIRCSAPVVQESSIKTLTVEEPPITCSTPTAQVPPISYRVLSVQESSIGCMPLTVPETLNSSNSPTVQESSIKAPTVQEPPITCSIPTIQVSPIGCSTPIVQVSPIMFMTPTIQETPSISCMPPFSNKKAGFLSRVGVSKKELTPRELLMYNIHRALESQMRRIKKKLNQRTKQLKELKTLYNNKSFEIINNDLNKETKNFIDAQIRNCGRHLSGKRWTEEDKSFALNLYKESPKIYKYLSSFFQLPSVRTMKGLISKISPDSSIQNSLENLIIINREMDELDRWHSHEKENIII